MSDSREAVTSRPEHGLLFIGPAGYNLNREPVLVIKCRCKWKHMSAIGEGTISGEERTKDYLRSRLDDHLAECA